MCSIAARAPLLVVVGVQQSPSSASIAAASAAA
jgi:hypothetical protein